MKWMPFKTAKGCTIYRSDGYSVQIKNRRWLLTYPDGKSASFESWHSATLTAEIDAESSMNVSKR